NKYVKPLMADVKVYVIVSDALRYECAEELKQQLNADARKSGNAMHEAEITAMLGVLPSYTALGMASLLPFESLDYKINPAGLDIVADGQSTSGHANREAIIAKLGGTAVKAD